MGGRYPCSGFCHRFFSAPDPLFVYLVLLQEITHPAPSVPGQLRLPVTRDATLEQNRSFCSSGFSREFLPWRKKQIGMKFASWYETPQGGCLRTHPFCLYTFQSIERVQLWQIRCSLSFACTCLRKSWRGLNSPLRAFSLWSLWMREGKS